VRARACPPTGRYGGIRYSYSLQAASGRGIGRRLLAGERGGALIQEGCIADAKVFGVEAIEALVVFRGGNRFLPGQAPHELLVPAGNQRRTLGDALRRRQGFTLDL